MGIMGLLFMTYLMKFATDVILIAPAAMGILIAVSRLWDGVSDPMAGYLSDRTRSRVGRRRIWMFGAAVPMGFGMAMIWSPPLGLSGAWLLAWMGLALVLYETASTAFLIPHGALGVELTPNYHERTRLFGWTHMITAIGTVVGLGALQLMNMAEDKRTLAVGLSAGAGVVVAVTVLWSTWLLPERVDYQGRGGDRAAKSFLDVFRNEHARLLLVVYAIETFGAASIGLLVPYLVEYVVPMKALMVPLLLTYVVPQFALVPMWIALSRRFGKKQVWVFSMLLSAGGFASLFVITEPGPAVFVITFVIGVAGACGAVIAPAIKADIIDYDEYRTGERKEGSYLAAWNLIRKSSASLAVFLAGLVLQFSGFEPNVEQPQDVKLALRAMIGLLPAVCYLVGGLLFARFSFNEHEHARIRTAIDERSR